LVVNGSKHKEKAMEFHEAADIFPLMQGEEFENLVADVKRNGLLDDIVVHNDGAILDGRNRYRACEEAGIEPRFRQWIGSGSAIDFVVSANLHRRHLNESQRAMVAERIATLRKHRKKPRDGQICLSQKEAAERVNVSERSVKTARRVRENAVPEITHAVEAGELSVSDAAVAAKLPEAKQRKALRMIEEGRAKHMKDAARRLNRQKKREALNTQSLETGECRYPVIYADPPWRYDDSSTDPTRQIENQYPTMSLEEICELDVENLATDDAVLFLWATSPKLEEALQVLNEWGFKYRTCAVWDKEKIGMGYFFRQRHELLLVGEKGSIPRPEPEDRVASVVQIARGQHSEKPAYFRKIIEGFYYDLPKIELFAREEHDGWDAWGNEV
jgi:N6-adenosine-specific RNA methylase IME4/anti-sigma28 factor (negative regulator of flagellin synthesis)